MGRGIHGIARPDFFPVLVESDPFSVADAVGAREDFGVAVGPSSGKGVCGVAQ
jgi:hypothetical protein